MLEYLEEISSPWEQMNLQYSGNFYVRQGRHCFENEEVEQYLHWDEIPLCQVQYSFFDH